jgi:hypothetical protein
MMQAPLTTRQVFFLLLLIAAIVYVPYIAVNIANGGTIPPHYFKYPPTLPRPKPGFNLTVYIIFIVVGVLFTLLYFVPRLFGFKKVMLPHTYGIKFRKFPIWFWVGLVMWGGTLFLMITQASGPKWIVDWSLLPLFWGFTLVLDGVVYAINNGESLVSRKPTELLGIGVASMSGWMIFDYLNFFIDRNWYYPKADLVNPHGYEFLIYAVLGSSGFFPMAFEWYYLLRKIKVLNFKYSKGPIVRIRPWLLWTFIIVCLVGMFITPKTTASQSQWFYILWLAPLIIVSSGLTLVKVWTPFQPIANGNWTAFMTFALTYLIQGVILEAWNYMSAEHLPGDVIITHNAAYWIYCIPYVYVGKIFEMPYLGYLGYLFFSIHCYVWWILWARLLNIRTEFGEDAELM